MGNPRTYRQTMDEEKRKKSTPFSVNLMRSQKLYWAAQVTIDEHAAPGNAQSSLLHTLSIPY